MEEKKASLTYLRRERRAWALTQQELATLFGYRSRDYLSRVEQGKREPAQDIVIACHALFGIDPRQMFPNLYADIEETTLLRVYEFVQTLEGKEGDKAERKRAFAQQVLDRAITRLNNQSNL